MEHLKLIYIFTTVLRHGSMTAAAAHIGMTPSAVSQHIRSLEKVYKVKLINRTTRSLTPTVEGKQLREYGEKLLEIEQQADRVMKKLQQEPEGEVRLTLPSGKAESIRIKNLVRELRKNYPGIRLVLLEDDGITNIAENNIDIALRFVEQPEGDNLIARYLVTWDTAIYASPDYLRENPITNPHDLIRAHWVNHSSNTLISVFGDLDLPPELPDSRTDCPGRVSVARTLAAAGIGLANLFTEDAESYVMEGKLTIVLPQVTLAKRNVYSITSHRAESTRVKIVLELLAKYFRE